MIDKTEVLQAHYETSKTVVDVVIDAIKKQHFVTDNMANKLAYILTQLKQGYTLTIYEDDNTSLLGTSTCTIKMKPITVNHAVLKDLEFALKVETLLPFTTLETSKPLEKMDIKFERFVEIFKEYANTKEMSLHVDIDWRGEEE